MIHRPVDYQLAKTLYQKERNVGNVIKSPRKFGVEFEMVPDYSKIKNDALYLEFDFATNKEIPTAWGIGSDGSLSRGGVEVQTSPMMLASGEDMIRMFCDKVKGLGWKTDKTCGIHVHLDANDIKEDGSIVRRMFLSYFVLDYSILAMIPADRRSNIYCSPLDERKSSKLLRHVGTGYKKGFSFEKIIASRPTKKDFLELFYKKSYEDIPREIREHYHEARYHGINFHNLYGRYGTLEVRYLEGTLEADIINNWIAFHQHIVDSARLIREVEAIELFHVKGPKTRLRRFAEMTKMPDYLLGWACKRIDEFKC